MNWRKLGKIFDPSDYSLSAECQEYAQSPQALVFDNFVRVYFSTRSTDPIGGKFHSHVAYVDFTKCLKKVIGVSSETVISPGELGCFDEHGIFPLNVTKVGEKVFGYISGWSRRVSVSVDTAIGLAISEDNGKSFTRVGKGPILGSSIHEPCLVGDPFVAQFDGVFHMWYIFGVGWKKFAQGTPPDRIYKIGHATSQDGHNWEKPAEGESIIGDSLGPDESQALPSVVFFKGRYHMYFCYRESFDFRENSSRGYRIGYAYSDDLTEWVRADEEVGIECSNSGWDSEMLCYPQVFHCNDTLYLLYNGNRFGKCGFGLAVLDE